MGKMKRSTAYLQGSSILEVMISTIIIMICILFFSSFVSSLFNSYPIVSTLKVLYGAEDELHPDVSVLDTGKIKKNYPFAVFSTNVQILDSIPVNTISISDQRTSKNMITYDQIVNVPNIENLFN